jgi:hypothetical protein
MPRKILDRLDELKRDHDSVATLQALLTTLKNTEINDPELLLRLHEVLLFLRAHPQSSSIVSLTETLLRSFPARLRKAEEAGADLTSLIHPDVSGIAGLSVTDNFSFNIVRWLCERNAKQVSLDWEWFEDENRLAQLWPLFMPLLDEDASVEANVPYQEWLRLARGEKSELSWLMGRFNQLQISGDDKARLYDGQKLYVTWSPDYRASRTGMRQATKRVFYQRTPLIQRRDVDFAHELSKPSPSFNLMSEKGGRIALDMAREASTIRYRELYGFTHGDPKWVFQAELGRGVELVITSLPPEKRLPLRASHAAMIYRNGVPVGYFEGLSLCERMESGFNLYYTFRDGETAWLYAQVLNAMRHFTGVSAFSVDPYQIGHENEEGIESGAFWFYYKLGFRPTRADLQELAAKESEKIGLRKGYRTSAVTLRKLAAGPMILELNPQLAGQWSNFQIRNVGFAVERLMGTRFQGDAREMKSVAVKSASELLDVRFEKLNEVTAKVFTDFALLMLAIPSINNWSSSERKSLLKIIRAKATQQESDFLKLTQHVRFRAELLRLGSA